MWIFFKTSTSTRKIEYYSGISTFTITFIMQLTNSRPLLRFKDNPKI